MGERREGWMGGVDGDEGRFVMEAEAKSKGKGKEEDE